MKKRNKGTEKVLVRRGNIYKELWEWEIKAKERYRCYFGNSWCEVVILPLKIVRDVAERMSLGNWFQSETAQVKNE